jgi:hypothetical protein
MRVDIQALSTPANDWFDTPHDESSYYYHILDDHAHQVVSLAVLADERARWRHRSHRSGRWVSGVRYNIETLRSAHCRRIVPAFLVRGAFKVDGG